MTAQEQIDQNIRMLLGDLQLQLIFARAEIADLQRQLIAAGGGPDAKPMPNGHDTGPNFKDEPAVPRV